jgi:hypothetical protein
MNQRNQSSLLSEIMGLNKMSTLEIPLTESAEKEMKEICKRTRKTDFAELVTTSLAVYDLMTELIYEDKAQIIVRHKNGKEEPFPKI